MVFKIDFINGNAVKWSKKDGKTVREIDRNYRPRFFIEGSRSDLFKARSWITRREHVQATCFEEWRTGLDKETEKVLRVDTETEKGLKKTVSDLKKNFDRTSFRFYHVSISPQFRYCLQEKVSPRPEEELESINISLPRYMIADKCLDGIKIDGRTLEGSNTEVLRDLLETVDKQDPDVFMVNRSQTIKLLNSELDRLGFSKGLGRLEQFQQLAGENTISSYGQVMHSSARYNIPGRILIDRSNSFMLGETTMEGLWDLVERSWKPLQELAWGSIGNLLTAIEIRKAYHEKEVLTPWKNWTGEKMKKASTLHKADRGGFIFNPKPEVIEDIHEVDFASMYPNIMITRNISPETVCCNCCDNSEVPELDFSICQEKEGFIPEVLRPLVEDRQRMKKQLQDGTKTEEQKKYAEGAVDAIKWLLVTCFGYMGHAHASYGAIECHQAINAYARKIMKDSKELFEENGWKIEHGIIDSIWVRKKDEDATEIKEVCRKVSEHIGIELEHEHDFEWVAFVPRSSSKAEISTLNRYFGKKRSGGFKKAGIETEQSSTPQYIKEKQKKMIEAFDRNREKEDVYKILDKSIKELEKEKIEPEKLVEETKTTKSLETYSVNNRTVAALKKARKHGIDYRPGQKIRYVVTDDSRKDMERVDLEFEASSSYDTDYYRKLLIRACESILSPQGIDREQIRNRIKASNTALTQFN